MRLFSILILSSSTLWGCGSDNAIIGLEEEGDDPIVEEEEEELGEEGWSVVSPRTVLLLLLEVLVGLEF